MTVTNLISTPGRHLRAKPEGCTLPPRRCRQDQPSIARSPCAVEQGRLHCKALVDPIWADPIAHGD